MRNDRKGSGMLESMTATMVVIIALTAFMGLFCYMQIGDVDNEEENFEFVKELEIKDGKIIGDVQEELVYLAESNGYSRTELRVSVVGDVNSMEFEDHYGETRTDDVESFRGTFEIGSDDGRSLVANYEVVIWR